MLMIILRVISKWPSILINDSIDCCQKKSHFLNSQSNNQNTVQLVYFFIWSTIYLSSSDHTNISVKMLVIKIDPSMITCTLSVFKRSINQGNIFIFIFVLNILQQSNYSSNLQYNNRLYKILILKWSNFDHILKVSNQNRIYNDHLHYSSCQLIN